MIEIVANGWTLSTEYIPRVFEIKETKEKSEEMKAKVQGLACGRLVKKVKNVYKDRIVLHCVEDEYARYPLKKNRAGEAAWSACGVQLQKKKLEAQCFGEELNSSYL